MRKWETKGNHQKNRTAMGTTDHDISMFGYKSAFLIMIGGMFFLFIGAYLDKLLPLGGYHIIHALIGGMGMGICFALSRYFIDSKKGLCKGFWVSFAVVSTLATLFIMSFYILKIAF